MSADSCTTTVIKNDINLQSLSTMYEPYSNSNNNNDNNNSNNKSKQKSSDLQANTKSFMFAKHKSFSLANLATTNNNNKANNKRLDSNNNSIDDYEDDYEFETNSNYNNNNYNRNSDIFSNSINLDEAFDGFNNNDFSNEQNEQNSVYQLASNINPIFLLSSTSNQNNINNSNLTNNTKTTTSINDSIRSTSKLSQNTNNKVIRSFLKLIRPSLNRKHKNRHMNAKSTSNLSHFPNSSGNDFKNECFELNTFKILNANETKKKNSTKKKTRGKLRSCRSIGVLNQATTTAISSSSNDRGGENDIDIEIFNIKENTRSKSKSVCRINSSIEISDLKSNSNDSTTSSQLAKNNKTTRAFSMINKSSMFSSSLSSYNSVSMSSTTNNSVKYQPKNNPVLSKELTWYKLQELDGYYKILGKFLNKSS